MKLNIDLSSRTWSASSLKVYLLCKRKFALNYIYNIKEVSDTYKPKAYEIGNILHKALENTYKTQQIFNNETVLYNTIISNINSTKAANPYILFDIELWKEYLKKFVSNEIHRFKTGVTIDKTEMSFTARKFDININGKIDRIDKLPDGSIDIIDYKSSKKTKVEECDFQLIFYLLALQEQNIHKLYNYNLFYGKLFELENINEKQDELKEIFKELKTKTVDFVKCEKLEVCRYCGYKTICQRD